MTRRAGAIIAVLFLMVIGILIASTVLVTADAAASGARAETSRTQSRALAWSGIQALMAELAEQREELIDGQTPDITAEWDLYTLDDGTRGVIRMIDLDPESLAILQSENAKLDINSASAEMLAGIPGLDKQLAERIVAARDGSPFTSVGQLLGVEGISPELVYGEPPSESGLPASDAEAGALPIAEGGAPPDGLARYLTVFSFDPNVQVGIDDSPDNRGNLRVNLDQEWSDKLGRAIADRFDQNTADAVQRLMESGQTFATDGELVQVLIDNNVGAEAWALVLDVFTTSDDQFLRGRVDVNTAPPEVLACIPGISPEQAGAIAEVREGIDPGARRSPAWLVLEGLLEPEEYAMAADWLTARSTQWRVRLEAGIERGDPLGFDESAPMTLDQLASSWDQPLESTLEHRIELEAVIDVASSRPRVAYLRDVTMLGPVMSMHRALHAQDESPVLPGDELDALAVEAEPESFDPNDPFFDEDPFLLEGPLDEEPPALNFDLGGSRSGDADQADPENPATDTPPAADPRDPPDMIDRRIGRWTTRKAGSE